MRELVRLISVEHQVSRYGNINPMFMGEVLGPPAYVNGIHTGVNPKIYTMFLSPVYPTENLGAISVLAPGDIVDCHSLGGIYTDLQRIEPRHDGTGVVQCQHSGGYPRCVTCNSAMVVDNHLWCSNPFCSGRTMSRFINFAGTQGLQVPHMESRAVVEELFRVLEVKDLSQLFDLGAIRARLAVGDIDEGMVYVVNGFIRSMVFYIEHLVNALPEYFFLEFDKLIDLLSYPGLPRNERLALCSYCVSRNFSSPIAGLAEAFSSLDQFREALSQTKMHDDFVRAIYNQVYPFAKELRNIAYAVSTFQAPSVLGNYEQNRYYT